MAKIHTLKQIETPRLIIRPVQLGDEIQINQAIQRSFVQLQQWMPWANDPKLETTREFVRRGVFAWDSECVNDFPMVIIHKENQVIIGASGYNDRSKPEEGLYETGYWCDINYQGQGYITECTNALTRFALSELSAKSVIITAEVDNIKSHAIPQRLGFINQGHTPSPVRANCTAYRWECQQIMNLLPLSVSFHLKKERDLGNEWA